MANGQLTTPQDATVTKFFNVLTKPGGGGSHTLASDLNVLMNQVFVPDNHLTQRNALPCVAVTEHGHAQGPAFYGAAEVINLFTQLFKSFPDVALTPVSDLRLYSPYTQPAYSPITIGVQSTLVGTFKVKWFPLGDPHYSSPLSDLKPAAGTAADPFKVATIPAVAVLTFGDPTNFPTRVTQLAIYTDRYHFVQTLHTVSGSTAQHAMREALEKITTQKKE
jgi:hypothetical protein